MKIRKMVAVWMTVLSIFLGAVAVNAKSVDDFQDVSSGDWFYPYVKDVAEQGLMTGLEDTVFGPGDNLARAQFVLILYRMSGEPDVTFRPEFHDVADNTWYTDAVVWASDNGIVTGYSNGNFGPGDALNREQMATMLYRYADNYLKSNPDYFTLGQADNAIWEFPDVNTIQEYAVGGVNWAVTAGIISGDNGMLNPQKTVVRAVCATMISRFVNVVGNPARHVHNWEPVQMDLKSGYACNLCYTDVTDWEDMYACHGGYHTHQWCFQPTHYECSCGVKVHLHDWVWIKPTHYEDGSLHGRGYYFCYSCFNFSNDGRTIDNSIQPDCDRWVTLYDFTDENYILLNRSRDYEDYELTIEAIRLSQTMACMTKGDRLSLTVTFRPETTTSSRALTWSSSDPSVVTVDDDGLVTAVGNGTATITVTSSNGRKDTCFIRVMDTNVGTVKSARLLIDGQDVTDGSITIKAGTEHTVTLLTEPGEAVYEVSYSVPSDTRAIYISGSSAKGQISEYSWQNGVKYTDPVSAIKGWNPGSSEFTAKIRDLNKNEITLSTTVYVQ